MKNKTQLMYSKANQLKRRELREAKAKPTFSTVRPKLNWLVNRPDGQKAFWDLEHTFTSTSLPKDRFRTFLQLLRLGWNMNVQYNTNIQSGLGDLMQILGYTDTNQLYVGLDPKDSADRFKMEQYMKQLLAKLPK